MSKDWETEADYLVNFSCGCKKELTLTGFKEENEKKVAEFEKTRCFTCQAKECKNKFGLAGSQKQVAWAENIIKSFGEEKFKNLLEEFEKTFKELEKKLEGDEDKNWLLEYLREMSTDRLLDASEWIDVNWCPRYSKSAILKEEVELHLGRKKLK